MNRIRVSIVEDDERVRKSLSALIERCDFCELVGVYSSAEAALEDLNLNPPEVLLMDIHLPGMSGVECVKKIRTSQKSTAAGPEIVMLTVYEESQKIFDALQAGATGYLLKRAGSNEILEAIQSVRQGGAPMSSHIARKVVQSFRQAPNNKTPDPEAESLSKREEEILTLVAQGYINKEIADMTGLSVETVRSYLKNIYKKLHVRSRTAAAMKYFS